MKGNKKKILDELRLEILSYSYWEHFKMEKDLAHVLPLDHPKRKKMHEHSTEILTEIHKMQKEEKKKKVSRRR